MPREEDPPAHEWLVLLDKERVLAGEDEERVSATLGGVDVGAMQVGDRSYVVISDAANRVVWMREASAVHKVSRCVG